MKRSEAIDRAIEIGKQDRANGLAIQNHYAHDDTLHDAYLRGYDPNGEIVKYRKGQTIDKDSCIKKDSLDAITKDIHTLAEIECTHSNALTYAEIVFVDDNGNQYEYDGVCLSEGKLKVAIKSNNPYWFKIKKRYVNSEGKLVTDLLPFNFETNEAIRKERELMPVENFLTRSEIDLYLNDGFTIHTYQASYCKEGHEFSPIEESK